METINFIFSSLFLGILCSIPGLLIGKVLSKKGLVRDGPWWVISLTVICMFGARLLFPRASILYIFGLLLLASISFYSNELWLALNKGPWWWIKSE